MASTTQVNYYQILGVPKDASAEYIRQRYRDLVLKFHPDRESSALAKEAMVLINNAYEVLSDLQRRAAYDTALEEQYKETCSGTSPQAKRTKPDLWTTMGGRKIPVLIAIALSMACLTGSQIETSHIDEMSVSNQFMKANRHYGTIVHEPLAALPLLTPVFGLIWGILGSFTTGLVGKAVIMTTPSHVLPYVILASMVKMAAYYIGMYRSMTLAVSIKRRQFAKFDRMFTLNDLVLVELLSLLAGYLEHTSATGGLS